MEFVDDLEERNLASHDTTLMDKVMSGFHNLLNNPPSAVIEVILSNINIGGAGNFALPGPNIFPSAQSSRSW